jgi:hypothetical protein
MRSQCFITSRTKETVMEVIYTNTEYNLIIKGWGVVASGSKDDIIDYLLNLKFYNILREQGADQCQK